MKSTITLVRIKTRKIKELSILIMKAMIFKILRMYLLSPLHKWKVAVIVVENMVINRQTVTRRILYLGKNGLSRKLNTHSREMKMLAICQVFRKHDAVTEVKHAMNNTWVGLIYIMHSIKSWICEG